MPSWTEVVQRAADRAAVRRTGVAVASLDPEHGKVFGGSGTVRRGGDHVTTRTLFEIGSITKVFTSLLLADEVVRGRLTLDTPLRAALPLGVLVPVRDGVDITLGQLATHRSGLPRSPVATVAASVDVFRGRDPYAGLRGDDLLDLLGTIRLRRTPGTARPAYSNIGAALLGRALMHVSGARDYGELVHRRVCAPLGMVNTDTRDRLDPGQRDRLAQGHHRGNRVAAPWSLSGLPGAGALVSTATDLMLFAGAQLQPDSCPLGAAIRLSQTPVHPGIALGWMHTGSPDPLLWHNGGPVASGRSWPGAGPLRGGHDAHQPVPPGRPAGAGSAPFAGRMRSRRSSPSCRCAQDDR